MKLIVGLGNEGRVYKKTRHNAGFIFVDTLAGNADFNVSKGFYSETLNIRDKEMLLAKPTTMMNASGKAVASLYTYYKLEPSDLYVVHDDLDIKLGFYKIQTGIGPKVHNGVNSIEEALGFTDFWRVRIGVDNRSPENRQPGEAYVLENFTDAELDILSSVHQKIASELLEKIA